ncbi:TonB-dependent receptor [Zoogloea sp.]|uniref:TonB-dependent receptor n=1 Tax=Zoogloea sp. TaxID=49181 RepID=UPI0025880F17|nr:TonB-dependent receptor [Zoogloea sp.]MDD2667794.1 TonB-dependent receptor [Zoogloea sp.]
MALRAFALVAAFVGVAGQVMADGVPTLDVVEVRIEPADLIGAAVSATEGVLTTHQLETRPLLRPAEVLEAVPGLIVSQHSGDGKANQYYLRGFNLDHGTDFATWLMGMPVNMPTHAHGQGYTDLNFLIPELVSSLRYRKGPYYAEEGDFSAAGATHIDYRRSLSRRFMQAEFGPHQYTRLLAAGSRLLPENGPVLLGAVEVAYNNGPWGERENLRKLNAVLRLSAGTVDNGWSATAMAYQSAWTATDQVPRRAVDNGFIDRFGSLDPTSGGKTSRSSLSAEWARSDAAGRSRAAAYLIDYRLDLFSNFTYALDNPLRGDQFEQLDRRQILGATASHTWFADWSGRPVEWVLGSQFRHDHIGKSGLFLAEARQRYTTVRDDRVEQTSFGLFGEARVQWRDTLRTTLGLRADQYRFDVNSDTPANSGQAAAFIAAPKFGVVLGPWMQTEFYANYGHGFHSNDGRGATIRVNPDPRSADYAGLVERVRPLVRARGTELGLRSALASGWLTTLALWRLDVASELLFVGDAGITEPSRPSRRQGVEWTTHWTPLSGLAVDADVAVSSARFRVDEGGGSRIPGALARVASLGVTLDTGDRWFGGLRMRYFGPRPLIEDNSVRSASSTLTNLKVGYRVDRHITLSLDVLNLFDRQLSDIDYYYESQLKTETAPVADLHSHPSEPRSLRLAVRMAL